VLTFISVILAAVIFEYSNGFHDAANAIATVVSRAEYRGVAGGVTYVFNKVAVFMGIFLFPSLFAAIGQANATLFVILFPVTGLLAAVFIFREVYGFQLD